MLTKLNKNGLDVYLTQDYYVLLNITKKIIHTNQTDDNEVDVLNSILLEIYNKPNNTIRKLLRTGKTRFYIINLLKRSITSETSAYHYEYNLYRDRKVDIPLRDVAQKEYIDNGEIEKYAEYILHTECNWFELEIFKRIVYDGYTFARFAKETNIPGTYLFITYTDVKRKLRKAIKNKFYYG